MAVLSNRLSILTIKMSLISGEGRRINKRKQHPEAELQHSAMVWFYGQYPDYCFISTHNESAYRAKEKYKYAGLYIGVADVIIIIPNKVLFIEFKAPKPHTSHISREQKDFEHKVKWLIDEECHLYCYDLNQFKDFINYHIII